MPKSPKTGRWVLTFDASNSRIMVYKIIFENMYGTSDTELPFRDLYGVLLTRNYHSVFVGSKVLRRMAAIFISISLGK